MRKIPFLQRLTNHASVIIQKHYPLHKNRRRKEIAVNYTAKEQYVVQSLLSLSEVETVLRQLEQSPFFLSNFRLTKTLKLKEITRFDHVIYHIESHLFRATGILDRTLILVNVIFKLGLQPESCKSHNILKNRDGKEGKYSLAIKSFDEYLYDDLLALMDVVDTYRLKRNQISHQKRYQSEKLENIEMFNILQSSKVQDEEFDITFYKMLIKNQTDKAVNTYKNTMLDFNQKVSIILDKIYLGLEQKWLNEYGE